jgi:hypothetical protein
LVLTVAKPRGIDFDVVKQIARALPGVEEHVSPRGTGFKVGGKLLACEAVHASAEPRSLMVRIGSVEREFLLAAEPDAYYLTDHYRGYPAVLVRLSKISQKALRERLEGAVKFVGAKRPRARR